MRAQMVPMTLKRKWALAARLALTLVPREASHAVTVVPIFSPRTTAAEILKAIYGSAPNHPFHAHVMVMAIAAEDDCTRRVSKIPAMRNRMVDPKPKPLSVSIIL